MERPAADGAKDEEHLSSAAKQWAKLGIKPKWPIVLSGPRIPYPIQYLWDWFIEISWGVAVSGFAPPQITWGELSAWSGMMGVTLEPWEAKALLTLSALRASIQAEKKPTVPKAS